MPFEKTAYCATCDRRVAFTLTPAPGHLGHANLSDGPELVCLDFSERCSSPSCAVTGEPRVVMGVRLARSGLRPEQWQLLRAHCDGCGEARELEVIDSTHTFCPVCGTTNPLMRLEMDDEEIMIALLGSEGRVIPEA